MELSAEFLGRYDFDWEILDVIIGGQSAIDGGNRLRIPNGDEAARFMESYGYDIENPIEKAELFGNFQEALNFIRHYFLKPENPDGLNLEVPRKIAELTDIGQLLVMASVPLSSPGQSFSALWSCAIIKVMHTISHMDKDLRSNYFTDIQKQILDRFYRFIHSDENGQVFLGKDARDSERVDLISFDSKPKKSRDSVILKLLHKSENVAEDIFDRVGIRFVTKNRFDALRVIKFLNDRHVILFANVKPSRSRNTLIDTKALSPEIKRILDEVKEGKTKPGDVYQRLVDFCEAFNVEPQQMQNPHTSRHYRTLQFTCRQLIKIKNPLFDDVKELKYAIKDSAVSEEISRVAARMDLGNIQREIRFFYPFEVQVFDGQSHEENLAGRSSHSNYKKSQIQAAMERVMGGLARFELESD